MNRAAEIVDKMLEGYYASPAPVAPPKPTTTPTRPQTPSKPRPGTRPWNPSVRPGVNPRPKARKDERSFAESEGATGVPPAPHDEGVPLEGEPTPQELPSLSDYIRPGDRVTIHIPAGRGRNGQEWKPATGRAVMRSSHGGWVLNMGGPHGTPGLADDENIISIRRGGKVIYGSKQ